MKEKIWAFWTSWNNDRKEVIKKLCVLKKAAMNKGYTLALAFTTGPCVICDKCNVEQKVCIRPTKARCSAQAVGINILQTLENAGMPMPYPFKKSPESFGLVLIA